MFLLRKLGLSACLLTFSLAAQAATVPEPIAQLGEAFERAYNAGDAAGIAALLTDDAQWLPPAEPPVVGKTAVQRRYASQFAAGRSVLHLSIEAFHASDSQAFIHGRYERKDAAGRTGAAESESGKYLMVLRHQPAGWRIAATIWNGDISAGAGLGVDPRVALGDFKALVEQRLASVARLFAALASTEEVQSGDWDTMLPLLREVAGSGLPAAAIWFSRPDGSYFTVERGATGASLADRPYFRVLEAGKPVTGALVISRSTGARSIVVASPVRRGAERIGAIGVSLSMDTLSRELDRQMRLPSPVVFYALDAHGQTALHRDPSLEMEYPSDLGDASLRSAVHEMYSKPDGVVRYRFRGKEKTVLFERSRALGWVFALGFERRPAGAGQAAAGLSLPKSP